MTALLLVRVVLSRSVSSAYVTYVAVDREGRPVPVPCVVPETEHQKRRFEDATVSLEKQLLHADLEIGSTERTRDAYNLASAILRAHPEQDEDADAK